MPDDPQQLARLHEAIAGSPTLDGKYDDALMGRLLVALDASWKLVTARGEAAKVTVVDGQTPGPWGKPASLLDDCNQQVRSRWRHDDASRWRNLAEASQQLSNILSVLAQTTPAPTTPDPKPPASSPVPANVKLVGSLDYETGDLSQWANLQTKDRNGSPGTYSTWRASVRDGGPGHSKAARFEVRDGDVPNFGGGERSEVRAGSKQDVKRGDEAYYVWSMKLGETSFAEAKGWGLIVMQWHSESGSPPLSIHAEDGQVSVRNDRPGGYTKNVCPIDAGKWHDYVLRVKWASDSNGLVEMWRDGQKLLSHKAANCVGGESNYLKAGIYRSSDNTATHVVWHDGLKVFKA